MDLAIYFQTSGTRQDVKCFEATVAMRRVGALAGPDFGDMQVQWLTTQIGIQQIMQDAAHGMFF